jgi:hypothetical protein
MSRGTLVLWVCVASVVVIMVGVFVFLGNSDDPPYSFRETLPHVVSDFGANARVADIRVSADDVVYEVMTSDGLVHVRDYHLADRPAESNSGRPHYRQIRNSVRDTTAADLRNAQLRLGDIPPGVVAKLFVQLRYSQSAGNATLEGKTWTLESDARLFDQYEARYDGTGLHQTRSRATVFLPKPVGQTETSTSTSTSQRATRATAPSAAPGLIKAERLLACVRRAHGDITKLVACQRRYGP